MWEIKEVDTSVENQILTGMILSTKFLRNVEAIYKPKYFSTPHSRLIATWCYQYLKKYKKAPGLHIQHVFETHRRNGLGDDKSAVIAKQLRTLSERYSSNDVRINSSYLLDQAATYFNERAVAILSDDLRYCLDTGDMLRANELISSFAKVEPVIDLGEDPFTDTNVASIFDYDEDILFRLPGALGDMIGNFEREMLVAIQAAYKRGKTWLLQYIGLQAYLSRLRVAHFTLEMPAKRQRRRLIHGLTGLPLKAGVYKIPKWDCYRHQTGTCKLARKGRIKVTLPKTASFKEHPPKYQPCPAMEGCPGFHPASWYSEKKVEALTFRKAKNRLQAVQTHFGGHFKLKSWPPYSAGLLEIQQTLNIWEANEGFIPDVIIVDYADILADTGVERQAEHRHKIDAKWQALKRLSHERKAMVVTASQVHKKVMDKKRMKAGDTAEDARKIGTVEILLGKNQTTFEKRRMIARIAVLAQREGDFDEMGECAILEQLQLSQPVLSSKLIKR